MRSSLVIAAATALVVAAAFALSRPWSAPALPATAAKQQADFLLLPPAAPAGQMVLYGHIKKLTRTGGRYEMRFDPAWFTSGVTASRAALEDTGSSNVPNDNYVRPRPRIGAPIVACPLDAE
jgi:hypothetical protein